jgi:hypothetical protein
LCGEIRYAIDRDGLAGQGHCHCRDCQRSTGSAFATFCFVPSAAFRAESGTAKGYTVQGESGKGVTRFFCPDCGAQLYSEVEVMPGLRFVKSGSLDDASWMEPGVALWCDSAQPWTVIPDGVQKHAANPG